MSNQLVDLVRQIKGYYIDLKATIEGLSGVPEGALAYATDTDEFGTFDGTSWTWGGGGGGPATWGAITGTLSDQTDLQTALDGKISHSLATATNDFLLGATGGGSFEKVSYTDTVNRLRAALDSVYGDVSGPGVSIDNNIVLFDGTAGDAIKDSGLSIDSLARFSGWNPVSQTWTFASADDPIYKIYVSGDITSNPDYKVGNRIKCTNNSTTFLGIIHKIGSYDAGNDRTPIDVSGGTDYDLANSAITAPCISKIKSPDGFPMDRDKWDVVVVTTDSPTKSSPVATSTWYGGSGLTPTGPSIDLPIGSWEVYYSAVVDINVTLAANTAIGNRVTLSTANNSESDKELTSACAIFAPAGTAIQRATYHAEKTITVSVKTTYYLNIITTVASTTSLVMNPSAAFRNVIRAADVYL